MKKITKLFSILFILGFILTAFVASTPKVSAQESSIHPLIVGKVMDLQNQPVAGVSLSLLGDGNHIISETETQDDGSFALPVPKDNFRDASIQFTRPHFEVLSLEFSDTEINQLFSGETLVLADITLERHISIGFWISTVIFVIVLVLIATGKLHNTLAALVGASLLLGISYLGYPINEELYIFDFTGSLKYIDWNVIFLIMGMMMFIAIVENTGIFQWMAFIAYRISRGHMLILLPILMLITGIASAFLDNVTTMLLMTPITVQIAIAVGINPLALLIPEVMASNVIGVSTLVGTPTNILIGSYGNISFTDFLTNLTPGVLLSFVGLLIYSIFVYKDELKEAHEASPVLMEKLAEAGKITQPEHLKKAGLVGGGMLLLFIFGEQVHLLPSVTALIGATALLVWIRPNVEEMIDAVDWTTLVFFMALFIVVGSIQEVGLISLIAGWIGKLVGTNILLAIFAITWFSAILSMVIANIPFTAAMLPVIGFLTATIPGAESKVLFFCLSIGSAMGGNGSLIGASANMVTAGIADAAGFKISYAYFIKKGFPAMVITVGLALIWIVMKF
ncbi:MAG: SLC13 family permease [Anaerolineales bacterium]|jgi:Na+/H+ antiporter NhaD/arsenite permease-like protein